MKQAWCVVVCFLLVAGAFAQKGKKKDPGQSADFTELDVTQLTESDALKLETILIDGEREFIKENYQQAYELFKKALELNPANAAVNFKVAEVLVQNGDPQNALAYAKKAMEMDPKNKYYLLITAEIYKSLSNLDQAAAIYQRLIDEVPGTETYLFDLAIIYQYQGKNDEALKVYERAEHHFGMNEFVLREKQKIYLQRNDFEALVKDWDKLIKENPEDSRYVIELCQFLIARNKLAEAKQRLEQLEDNQMAELLLSEIALAEGNTPLAISLARSTMNAPEVDTNAKIQLLNEFLERAISPEDFQLVKTMAEELASQYPEVYEVQAFSGDVMFRLEDRAKARDYYLKAVAISPSNYGVWQNILNIEAGLNQYDQVIQHAEQALEYFPSQGLLYYFAGTGYLIEKNFKRAVQLLEQGRRYVTDPNLLTIFYGQMGDAYHGAKENVKAYEAYEKALQTDPANDHVLNNYSYYLSLEKRELDKALAMSGRLVKAHPDNATYLDTHGWVLYVRGEYEAALPFLEKAANMEEDGTVIEHYGDVLYKMGREDEALKQWMRAKEAGGASDDIDRKIANRKLYE